jgi:hypothetical protein
VALGYRHTNGYDRERLASEFEAGTQYRFGRSEADPRWWEPRDIVVWMAVLGGGFGIGVAAASRVVPLRPVAAGGLCGVSAWAAYEIWYRRASGLQRWAFPRPTRAATMLALYGAAVACLTDGRP